MITKKKKKRGPLGQGETTGVYLRLPIKLDKRIEESALRNRRTKAAQTILAIEKGLDA